MGVKTHGSTLRNSNAHLCLGSGRRRRNGSGIRYCPLKNPRRAFLAALEGLSQDEKQLKWKEYQSQMHAKKDQVLNDIASFQASLEADALSPEQRREQWNGRIAEVRARFQALQQQQRQHHQQ